MRLEVYFSLIVLNYVKNIHMYSIIEASATLLNLLTPPLSTTILIVLIIHNDAFSFHNFLVKEGTRFEHFLFNNGIWK